MAAAVVDVALDAALVEEVLEADEEVEVALAEEAALVLVGSESPSSQSSSSSSAAELSSALTDPVLGVEVAFAELDAFDEEAAAVLVPCKSGGRVPVLLPRFARPVARACRLALTSARGW